MKKYILSIISVSIILLTINSCKKGLDSYMDSKINVTVDNLTSNIDFIKLVQLIDLAQTRMLNSSNLQLLNKGQVKKYMNSTSLTDNQMSDVAQYYGYSNKNDFIELFKTQSNIIKRINSYYSDINLMPIDSIKQAIINVHSNLIASKYIVNYMVDPDLCKRIYDNCMTQASAVYTAAVIACGGAAVGVGAVTAGVGGVIFYLGCGGAAYWNLSSQRDACSLNFEKCK